MTGAPACGMPLRVLFVGGPGRSGTSFVADRLGTHPQVVALNNIELKIFCEKNGLQDLYHALVETYSPNRAQMALDHFRRMTEALIGGSYGQPPLAARAPASVWRSAFAGFIASLTQDGHPVPHEPGVFLLRARVLLRQLADIASGAQGGAGPAEGRRVAHRLFLEKTPHNLLAIDFLARLAPGARFLHVMRDPRSIAWSLVRMRWGPSELSGAARWVASYCHAWTRAEARAADLGLPLVRTHIEDIARDPDGAAIRLMTGIGLDPAPGLFRGADLAVLNRWAAAAPPADRALLDAALGGWVAHFGYDPGRIGHRLAASAPGDGDAPPPSVRDAPRVHAPGPPRQPASRCRARDSG